MHAYIIGAQMTENMATAAISTQVHPISIVQGEWDHTLQRLRAICTVAYATERVSTHLAPTVEVNADAVLDVHQVERILFDNLLLAPLHRVEHGRTIVFQCQWLWSWRKAVPWKVDALDSSVRMGPDRPRAFYTYRYNVVEVE